MVIRCSRFCTILCCCEYFVLKAAVQIRMCEFHFGELIRNWLTILFEGGETDRKFTNFLNLEHQAYQMSSFHGKSALSGFVMKHATFSILSSSRFHDSWCLKNPNDSFSRWIPDLFISYWVHIFDIFCTPEMFYEVTVHFHIRSTVISFWYFSIQTVVSPKPGQDKTC